MENPQLIGRIDRYLFQRMNADESAQFEAEVSQNPELAKALRIGQLEHRSMALLQAEALRAQMKNWEAEKKKPQGLSPVWFNGRLLLQAAAAATLLIASVWYLQRLGLTPDSQATALFQRHAPESRVRGNADAPQALRPALQRMEAGDYAAAITALDQTDEPAYVAQILLLRGECQFRLSRYTEAAAQFREAAQIGSPAQREEAEFLWMLALMAAGNDYEAVRQRILSDTEHAYFRIVQKIK